jgi:hypothetical protein
MIRRAPTRNRGGVAVALVAGAALLAACGGGGGSVGVGQSASTTTSSTPTSSTSAPSSTTTTTAPTTATTAVPAGFQRVAFQGLAVDVPKPWPVYTLSTDPTRCVRLDLNAVYLGQEGQTPNCPARQIGHTETVQIEPLNSRSQPDAATATQAETLNGLSARVNPNATTTGGVTVVFPDLQLVAIVTFGQSPALALQIVQTLGHA